MASLMREDLYPRPSKVVLREAFVGKHLKDVPTPAAILDRAVVRRNCQRLLQACENLNLQLRAHVKTHKVREEPQLPCLCLSMKE